MTDEMVHFVSDGNVKKRVRHRKGAETGVRLRMESEMRGNVHSPTAPANQLTKIAFRAVVRFRRMGKTVESVIFPVLYEKTEVTRQRVSLKKRRNDAHFVFGSLMKIGRVFQGMFYGRPNAGNVLQGRFRKLWRKDESRT